jgi:hypothetical protein
VRHNWALAEHVNDPTMQAADLPLEATFYPLGYSVNIATNSSKILRAAEESWGRYRQQFPSPKLHLRIVVSSGDPASALTVPVCRTQRHLLVNIADPENFSVCDLARGFGFSFLSSTAAENADYVRYHFIESMVYSMLANLCLTPIHAGCVSLDGRGVLLFGSSGAGKSCLAFACAKRGWTYLSDDGSSLVRGRHDSMVLGKPYRIRFRESAADLFPELQGLQPAIARDGEPSIEIDITEMPGIATATSCLVERVVFLQRSATGAARLMPLEKLAALGQLESELPVWEQHVSEEQKASLRALFALPTVTLHYSNPDSAVDLLEGFLRQ